MMVHWAASEEVADSNFRRLLAYNKSFKCTDVQICYAALLLKATNQKDTACGRLWRRSRTSMMQVWQPSFSIKPSRWRVIACRRRWSRRPRRRWGVIPRRLERDPGKLAHVRTAHCGTRGMRWKWTRRRRARLPVRGFQEPALIPPPKQARYRPYCCCRCRFPPRPSPQFDNPRRSPLSAEFVSSLGSQ